MVISIIIIWIIFLVFMCIYIILKHQDWYLFLFPMFLLSGICYILSLLSDILSVVFSIGIAGYFVYNLTNKEARKINNEIKQEREKVYQEYKKEEVNNQFTFKNYTLTSGKKVDYIDFNSKTFYLLRPYTENVEKKYKKEVKKYLIELEKVYGGDWNYIIDTY